MAGATSYSILRLRPSRGLSADLDGYPITVYERDEPGIDRLLPARWAFCTMFTRC